MESTTAIISLIVGDYIYTAKSQYLSVYSDVHYQTSMMGFLYSPSASPAVAWLASLHSTARGYVDPIVFKDVLVNAGNGYNSGTGRFTAPHAGLYYVTITATQYLYTTMKMELLLNGVTKAAIKSYLAAPNWVTRSRAIVLRLNVDDELRVRQPDGHEAQGCNNEMPCTTFSGLRIAL